MTAIEVAPETRAVVEFLTTGKPIEPDVRERIRDKARRIRDRILKEHSLVNIAVSAIRELRDEARS
jgi:hypothetical protein